MWLVPKVRSLARSFCFSSSDPNSLSTVPDGHLYGWVSFFFRGLQVTTVAVLRWALRSPGFSEMLCWREEVGGARQLNENHGTTSVLCAH